MSGGKMKTKLQIILVGTSFALKVRKTSDFRGRIKTLELKTGV